MTNTEKFLEAYLNALGIEGTSFKSVMDGEKYLINVEIPKTNNEKIGILKGKNGRNLTLLKQLVQVIGLAEGISPFVIIKLK